MKATETALLMAKVRQEQQILAEKDFPKHLAKCIKQIKSACRRKETTIFYSSWIFLSGYNYYWTHLFDNLLKKELEGLGYGASFSWFGNDPELRITWEEPPESHL